jgi:hypothetical protein
MSGAGLRLGKILGSLCSYWESIPHLEVLRLGIIMPVCKLCLRDRKLLKSHLMPSAAYKSLRGVLVKNPNPTAIADRTMVRTSFQMSDYLLCAACEARFNRNGEEWVMRRIATSTGFPLRDILSKAAPEEAGPGWSAYACSKIAEIDVEKLTYFAMSIFWRAAAHTWKWPYGGSARIDLGSYRESARIWLMGESPFPVNVGLTVSVDSENRDIFSLCTPFLAQRTPYHAFIFYAPGIEFVLWVGRAVPASIRKSCIYSASPHPIFMTEGVAARMHTVLKKSIARGTGSIKMGRWLEREKKF